MIYTTKTENTSEEDLSAYELPSLKKPKKQAKIAVETPELQITRPSKELRSLTTFADGSVYQGEWSTLTGMREGRGILIWPDGSRYDGHWQDSMFSGYGRLVKAQNIIYEGEWKEGKAHGKGFELNKNKSIRYEGHFKNGVIEGIGKMTFGGDKKSKNHQKEYIGQW